MTTRSLFLLIVLFIASLSCGDAAPPRLPVDVFRVLDAPAEVTVYSLNPDARACRWWFSRCFHDYRIIGQVAVTDPAQRRQVAAAVRKTAQTYTGDTKCIFHPRHGVRLTRGSTTYDFVICFECSQMEVYAGDRRVADLSATGSPEVLNRILRSAHVRIAE